MDPALAEAWKHSLGGTASHLLHSASQADVSITVPQAPSGNAAVPPAWLPPAAPIKAAAGNGSAWYRNTVFTQFAVCTGVFLASFVLLVAIRPPFMYQKPKNKLGAEEFVPIRAFYIALAAAVLAAASMLTLAMMSKYKVAGL